MNTRQIIQIGTALPPGISQQEFNVAQVSSLVAWPGLSSWAVNTAGTGVSDRYQRNTVILANGKTSLASRIFAEPTTGEIAMSIQDVLTGIVIPSISLTGDFTFGVRFSPSSFSVSGGTWGGVAIGSYSSSTNGFRVENDTSGRLRMGFPGAVGSAYTDYTGPVMAQGAYSYLVFSLSRSLGQARLRVNGTYEQILSATSLKTATLAQEVAFGLFNTGTVTYRAGFYRKPMAFSAYLLGTDLAALEAYLASTTAD